MTADELLKRRYYTYAQVESILKAYKKNITLTRKHNFEDADVNDKRETAIAELISEINDDIMNFTEGEYDNRKLLKLEEELTRGK